MTKTEGCVATMLACIIAVSIYLFITFGLSYLIAYLVVSLGFATVSVPKLALLILLVKTLVSSVKVNGSTFKKDEND